MLEGCGQAFGFGAASRHQGGGGGGGGGGGAGAGAGAGAGSGGISLEVARDPSRSFDDLRLEIATKAMPRKLGLAGTSRHA